MSDETGPSPEPKRGPEALNETIRIDPRHSEELRSRIEEHTRPHGSAEPSGSAEPGDVDVAEPLDLLQAVMSALPTGILLLDPHGAIAGLNRAAAQVFESPAERLLGRRLVELRGECESMLWPADRGEVLLVARGREGELELSSSKVLGFTSRPIHGPDGRTKGTVVSFSDITEEKLRERDDAHRRRLEDLGRIAAMLAHEIRNPVFAIQSMAQVLAGEPVLAQDPELRQFADRIVDETRRIAALVDDLLLFGRRRTIRRRPCDMVALLRAAIERSRDRSIREGVDVDVDLVCVQPDETYTWAVDADAMTRLFTNLIANGIEAIARKQDPDGPRRVTVTLDRVPGLLTVTVRDTGVGIPEDLVERVFDEFFTTRSRGTGLGLAVCRSIVQQHGGSIILESDLGRGTTVTVQIPA